MQRAKIAGVVAAAMLLTGATPTHGGGKKTGSFALSAAGGPFIAGSRILVDATGIQGTFSLSVLGPGRIQGHEYIAPVVTSPQTATLIGAARGAVAYSTVRIVPPPPPGQPLLAVATYDSGIALHDPNTFAIIGYAPIGGPPGDVAFEKDGSILSADTDGDVLTYIKRDPWTLERIRGVPEANEIAVDSRTGNIFVSDRDAGPTGALTRVTPDGQVRLVPTGNTAEGLTIDEKREVVYVGNVNEHSVAMVDARTMRVLRKLPSVDRTFGIALDAGTRHLYAVSNDSPGMNTHGGYVAEIDAASTHPHIVRRSSYFTFPLGIVLDAPHKRLFVTDEATNVVYVLNAKTLGPVRDPLETCRTPWRPHIANGRIFVPCARDNKVDVFDLATLRRVAGAPFATGGFPLSVATWP